MPRRIFPRHPNWSFIAWAVTLCFVAFLFWNNDRQWDATRKADRKFTERVAFEAQVRDYKVCQTQNNGRSAIVNGFNRYTDVLIGVASTNQGELTDEQRARRAEAVAAFKKRIEVEVLSKLAPVVCPPKPVSKTSP